MNAIDSLYVAGILKESIGMVVFFTVLSVYFVIWFIFGFIKKEKQWK